MSTIENFKEIIFNNSIKNKKKFILYYKSEDQIKKYLIKKVSKIWEENISLKCDKKNWFDYPSFHTPKFRYDKIDSVEFIDWILEIDQNILNEFEDVDVYEYLANLNKYEEINWYSKAIITKISDWDWGQFLKEWFSRSAEFRIKFIDAPEMLEKNKDLKSLAEKSYKKLLGLIPPKTIVYLKEYWKDLHWRLLVEVFYLNPKEENFYNIWSIILQEWLAIPFFIDDWYVIEEKVKEYMEYAKFWYENNLWIRNNDEIRKNNIFSKSLEVKEPLFINWKNILEKISFIWKYKYENNAQWVIISTIVWLNHYKFKDVIIKKWDNITLKFYDTKNWYKNVIIVLFDWEEIWTIPDPNTDFWKKFISIEQRRLLEQTIKLNINNEKTWSVLLVKKESNKNDLRIKVTI